MYANRISEIIAHFIGLFDTEVLEARMRINYLEGRAIGDDPDLDTPEAAIPVPPVGNPALDDYTPGVHYAGPRFHYDFGKMPGYHDYQPDIVGGVKVHTFSDDTHGHNFGLPSFQVPVHFIRHAGHEAPKTMHESEPAPLKIHDGPGSIAGHVSQVNLLQDDDRLDMTGTSEPTAYDFTHVREELGTYYEEADSFNPFSDFHRTDSYEGVKALADQVHIRIAELTPSPSDEADAAGSGDPADEGLTQTATLQASTLDDGPEPSAKIEAEAGPADPDDTVAVGKIAGAPADAAQNFVVTGEDVENIWVDGQKAAEAPKLDDVMPERGIAAQDVDPDGVDGPLQESGTENSLTVAAGANIAANVTTLVNTGVISPVTAVMGDYHQVDSVTQSWVYSDKDDIDDVFSSSADKTSSTVASNVASFTRDSYTSQTGSDQTDDAQDPAFPHAWRVSVLDGDVSFINWIEQFNFVTDNDSMTVTTTGCTTSILTGGNALINLAGMYNFGMQYDLVIVGGNVLDINMISQVSILYDNDTIHAMDGAGAGATVQSSNNLLWNDASITNIGANDRFEAMPDYMAQTVNHIKTLNPDMPEGLSMDALFAGKEGLNVLYISGNLFDVNYIRQVSMVGDSDHVTLAMANVLKNNDDATVTIDTGSNAVINIAAIVDYDTFGSTTYLAGNLYSDAVLIQGGIIEDDDTVIRPVDHGLANEVIAFLHDDSSDGTGSDDAIINAGHDQSWALAHPVDVMQTTVA